MKRILMSILLSGLLSGMCAAQNVKVKVRAALYDRDLNVKPVPHLVVKLVPSAPGVQTVSVQTTLDGLAEAELPAGNYHVVTDSPVELFDKSYRWEFDAVFTRPENTLELSNDNAKATALAGARDARVDELAYQYKRVRDSVVRVQTEYGVVAGVMVDSAGLVLTVQHPLEQTTWLAVQLDDRRKLSATVVAADKQKDVAVLRINPSGAGQVAPAELSSDPGALIEGERVFIIENRGRDKERKLHTGVISRADSSEIVSDATVSQPGSPLFNSSGNAVGLSQFGNEKFRIVPMAIAREVLAEAKLKLATGGSPSPRLLPTAPQGTFPAEGLRAPARGHWEKDVYSFKAGDFYVELVTPVAQYEADTASFEQEMKEYSKHSKGRTAPVEPEHNYDVVLRIAAIPKTKMPFWENMANSSLTNGRAPAVLRYKTGFAKMRLLCGEKEVDPIWPGHVTEGPGRGWNTVLADESSGGRYVYAHDAISPQCGKVTLQLFSTKDSDRPVEKVLDAAQVTRIWQDFEPYRRLQASPPGAAAQQ
jgi:S1-C subfamily serine protease